MGYNPEVESGNENGKQPTDWELVDPLFLFDGIASAMNGVSQRDLRIALIAHEHIHADIADLIISSAIEEGLLIDPGMGMLRRGDEKTADVGHWVD